MHKKAIFLYKVWLVLKGHTDQQLSKTVNHTQAVADLYIC